MSLTNGVITVIPPPEGYIVDFDNPTRQSNIAAYWVCGVGMVLAFIFLIQRLYVKVIIGRSFGFDDGKSTNTTLLTFFLLTANKL